MSLAIEFKKRETEMQLHKGILLGAYAIGLSLSLGVPANAAVLLDFVGLNEAVQEGPLNYYDGGFGSNGSGPGPNYGITFSSNSSTCQPYPAGGCNTQGLPSGNALFYYTGPSSTMDVTGGFTTGFSFYYTSPFTTGTSVSVYSGLDGTGTLLATLSLPQTPSDASCVQPYCPYEPIGVAFAGTAYSVDFAGTTDQVAFGDITLGSVIPQTGVPEPFTLSLLGAGLAGAAAMRRRRKQRA